MPDLAIYSVVSFALSTHRIGLKKAVVTYSFDVKAYGEEGLAD
jgi:hypothetical protein